MRLARYSAQERSHVHKWNFDDHPKKNPMIWISRKSSISTHRDGRFGDLVLQGSRPTITGHESSDPCNRASEVHS